jgi:acyl-CoA thioester hydrolase
MRESRLVHRVQWGETDAAGIVFYPNYYRWFDQATHELFRALGYTVPQLTAEGFVIPLIETKARFSSSLRLDDEVVVTSHIGEVRTRAFRIDHMVTHGETLACTGYEVRIWARQSDGEILPEPLPTRVRAVLGQD